MSTTIKVYDEALHRQVEEYMAAHKLSQEQMGVKLGRSGAAINQYLSRKYKGSVENLEKAFREFLAQEGEAVATQKQAEPYKLDEGYKPTSISEDVSGTWKHASGGCDTSGYLALLSTGIQSLSQHVREDPHVCQWNFSQRMQ